MENCPICLRHCGGVPTESSICNNKRTLAPTELSKKPLDSVLQLSAAACLRTRPTLATGHHHSRLLGPLDCLRVIFRQENGNPLF